MRRLILCFSFFLFSGWCGSFALAQTVEPEARFTPPPVLRGDILPGPSQDEMRSDPKSGKSYIVDRFIPTLSSAFVIIMFMYAVVMLVVAGYFYIFSSGDPEMAGKAKSILLWALAGVVIGVLAFAIVQFLIGLNFEISLS